MQSESVLPVLIDAKRLALEIGGVHRNTVTNWVNQGILPKPIRVGRRTFWKSKEVLEAINALPEAPEAGGPNGGPAN